MALFNHPHKIRTPKRTCVPQDLILRDRCLIALSATIVNPATGRSFDACLNNALRHGLTAIEITEVIRHLAFYAGRAVAAPAAETAQAVFQRHGLADRPLPKSSPVFVLRGTPIDTRQAGIIPSRRDLWRRSYLSPRDRSLATIAALIAKCAIHLLPDHVVQALGDGLSRQEIEQTFAHVAFFTTWQKAFGAWREVPPAWGSRSFDRTEVRKKLHFKGEASDAPASTIPKTSEISKQKALHDGC